MYFLTVTFMIFWTYLSYIHDPMQSWPLVSDIDRFPPPATVDMELKFFEQRRQWIDSLYFVNVNSKALMIINCMRSDYHDSVQYWVILHNIQSTRYTNERFTRYNLKQLKEQLGDFCYDNGILPDPIPYEYRWK